MKALTLRHPWPFMVAFCGKDVENRDWDEHLADLWGVNHMVGDTIAIHGGTAPQRPKRIREISKLSPNNKWRRFIRDLEACRYMLGELPAEAVEYLARRAGNGPLMPEHFIVTGICAVAQLGQPTRASRSRWAMRDHLHLPLINVHALSEPLEASGAQGFWTVDEDAAETALEQYRRNYLRPSGAFDTGGIAEWLGM